MVSSTSTDTWVQHCARISLQGQASDLIQQQSAQYVESTKLFIESNKLSVQAHRIRAEARDLHREIRIGKAALTDSPDIRDLEDHRQALNQAADELQAQAVQLLAQVMRLRACLMPRPLYRSCACRALLIPIE